MTSRTTVAEFPQLREIGKGPCASHANMESSRFGAVGGEDACGRDPWFHDHGEEQSFF